MAHASACRGELQFAVWPRAEAHGSTLKRATTAVRLPLYCASLNGGGYEAFLDDKPADDAVVGVLHFPDR